MEEIVKTCKFPKRSWYCTQEYGHDGPCPARPRWWLAAWMKLRKRLRRLGGHRITETLSRFTAEDALPFRSGAGGRVVLECRCGWYTEQMYTDSGVVQSFTGALSEAEREQRIHENDPGRDGYWED